LVWNLSQSYQLTPSMYNHNQPHFDPKDSLNKFASYVVIVITVHNLNFIIIISSSSSSSADHSGRAVKSMECLRSLEH
jgi:hypothetical protein